MFKNMLSLGSITGWLKYWSVFLFSIFVVIFLVTSNILSLILRNIFSYDVIFLANLLLQVLLIPLWIFSITTTVKRFHDRDNGWWFLVWFIPVVGVVCFVILVFGFISSVS